MSKCISEQCFKKNNKKTFIKSCKKQDIVESYDCPCPQRAGHIKQKITNYSNIFVIWIISLDLNYDLDPLAKIKIIIQCDNCVDNSCDSTVENDLERKNKLSLKDKLRLLHALVWSVFLYECES